MAEQGSTDPVVWECRRCGGPIRIGFLCADCASEHPTRPALPAWTRLVLARPDLALRYLYHDGREKAQRQVGNPGGPSEQGQ